MSTYEEVRDSRRFVTHIEESPVSRSLFGEVSWAWLWLIVRLYVGWQWLEAGLGKLSNPAWIGSGAGKAITGFIQGALSKNGGAHPDVQGWYAWFLQNAVLPNARLWSYLITFGEMLVGIALILGIFTGIAAFFGSFMNANYLLSGTVSSNPVLLILAILLVMAWRTAGWLGMDRWVLPALGTPWRPGFVFLKKEEPKAESTG